MKLFNKRLAITISLLRGVLLFVAGLVALFFPETALRFALLVGGCLLIVDGVLGAIASQNYAGDNQSAFWLSIIRGALAVLAGLAVLFSPLLVPPLSAIFLSTAVGIGAILIGLIELYILLRYRRDYPTVWSTVIGGLIYIALGALLLALPMSGALLIMKIAGGLLAAFGLVLLVRAWMTSNQSLGGRPAH